MHRLILVALGLSTLCAGCANAPARIAVTPEPERVLLSGECSELGIPEHDSGGSFRFDPKPYGWAQVRIDVERGAVVNVEVLSSSPPRLFDAQAIAVYKSMRFPSLATAHGCVWTQKWG